MALLTPQSVAVTGTNVSFAAATSGGDTVKPDGRSILRVKNGDSSAKTVTLVVPGTTWGQNNPDIALSIPAGEERSFALPKGIAAAATGLISITYSAVTSVTVAVVRI